MQEPLGRIFPIGQGLSVWTREQEQVTTRRAEEGNRKASSHLGSRALNLAPQPPAMFSTGPRAALPTGMGPAGRWVVLLARAALATSAPPESVLLHCSLHIHMHLYESPWAPHRPGS